MATWSRSTATMAMTSPLGTDVLIPISLTAYEALSQPFNFDVVAVCQNGVIDPNSLLNNPACVVLQDETGNPIRYFHGIVRSVTDEGPVRSDAAVANYELYRLTLVPRLWFLGQTTDCRVREQMSAGDILSAMFNDAGLTDLSGPPSSVTRQYSIQYNETDLHFATRLMEEEGWFYFFQHTASAHTLVIANQNTAFTAIPNATMYIVGGADSTFQMLDFDLTGVTVRGQMTLQDYEPVSPDAQLQSVQPTVLATGGAATRDDFRWPASVSYTNESGTDPSANASDNIQQDGTVIANRAKWEMEGAEALATLYDGSCQFGGMVAGGTFTISSQPASAYDNTYVVRSVTHHAADDTWLNQSGVASYSNRLTAFLSSTTWRQPITTRRPVMSGIYTALVMGPQSSAGSTIASQSGEEIYTDDMARVKVRFYWDWRAESTGSNAVWARVIQPWAGKGWGAQFIPRVGTEVAVAFVDSDPDRPIVIGGLYNGRDTPIYLSADKTKSGIRTRSSLSGSTSQFNEFTFDDNAGNELIFLHAEKDLFTEVENNQTLTVDNNRIVTVKQNETVAIQNNQTITVTQDRALTVSNGNSTFDVGTGNHTVTIDKGNQSVTISKGNSTFEVSTGNHTETIDQGNYSIQVNAGQMTVQAMQSLELTVGQSSIKLTPQGITISGAQISLTGQMKGSFDGGIELDLKGAMVKIN
ncbi:MAG: type VI secretion system tip protein TssI/VgrG [Acetobacteraceae bacterium]|jgi:type VI secretion system secreted protein VgrG